MPGPGTIRLATDRAAILLCHGVMRELRPLLVDAGEFAARVERQQAQGYHLACVEAGGEVRSVAGFRFLENLHAGKFVYVDDLVTRAADHGAGFGSQLFDWLLGRAREAGCAALHLDSGVQRFGAHRFYLGRGMDITSHHFAVQL